MHCARSRRPLSDTVIAGDYATAHQQLGSSAGIVPLTPGAAAAPAGIVALTPARTLSVGVAKNDNASRTSSTASTTPPRPTGHGGDDDDDDNDTMPAIQPIALTTPVAVQADASARDTTITTPLLTADTVQPSDIVQTGVSTLTSSTTSLTRTPTSRYGALCARLTTLLREAPSIVSTRAAQTRALPLGT
jgi:hypothetical protein